MGDKELPRRYETFAFALFAVHAKVSFPALSTPTHAVELCSRCGVEPERCHVRILAAQMGLAEVLDAQLAAAERP